MNVKKLMKEHKRLLEKTKLGAWDIYYNLEVFIGARKDEDIKNVYCKDCKYFNRIFKWRGHRIDTYPIIAGDNPFEVKTEDCCDHPNAKTEVDTYYGREEKFISPSVRNKNNDCPDYSKKMKPACVKKEDRRGV